MPRLQEQVREERISQAFTQQERRTLAHACRIAAERFYIDADEFLKVVTALKAKQTVPMFASGEAGIRAAKGLREQFIRQAKDTEALAELLED